MSGRADCHSIPSSSHKYTCMCRRLGRRSSEFSWFLIREWPLEYMGLHIYGGQGATCMLSGIWLFVIPWTSCQAPPSKGFPRHCLLLVCGRSFLPESVCFGFWNSQGVLQCKTTLSFLWRYWLRLGVACWCFKVKCPLQHYSPRNLDSVHPCLSWLPDHTGWKLASLSLQHSSSLLTSTCKRII